MRTCTVEGCPRKHIAKGMCQKHYVKAQRKANGREAAAMHPFPCGSGCGKTVMRTATQARRYRPTCSDRCKYYLTNGRWPERSTELVGPIPKTCPIPVPPKPRESRTRLLGVSCEWCTATFIHDLRVTGANVRYCTTRCGRAAAKARRDAIRGRFAIAPAERLAIYERDAWTCQLCHAPVDPNLSKTDRWAATLDHIECQSWALIPDHSPTNLRLAHRMCNSIRADERHISPAA